jgi:uncharacterized membrane protein YkvA (DUF1232 family)
VDAGTAVGIVAGLLAAWVVLLAALWLLRPRDVRLRDLLVLVPDVVRLGHSLLVDGTVPLDVRVALAGLLVWILSPIDLIPEFVPVLGPLDDVVVAVLVLRYVARRVGQPELQRRWQGSVAGFDLLAGILGVPGNPASRS